ncbi:Sortase family protein [Actinacidiphila alni]|uniref:Sortase family protein n=1 Tax=Actinacidiphila alni TaxID=380248 RepID=A0A1I2KB05_9ACTN|nr:class F sortase [Actinacidiphila alni]SFF64235.1 Sortase family protein [Actinacidiphila alni]
MAEGPDGGGGEDGPRPDSRKWTTAAVALVLLAAWLFGHHDGGGGATPGGRAMAAAAADRPREVYAPHVPMPASRPLRVDIDSIGLHAKLVARGLKDGAVDPPPYSTPDVAGWYRDGPSPGTAGAALIVGHVDTETRAAVFYGLSTIEPGALVEVGRADGTVAEFSVEAVEVVQKDHFDANRVYGSAGRPELRLITCGGSFDKEKQAYSANVVVFAALTGTRDA